MNIALLILGVFFIILSIVLIILSSNGADEKNSNKNSKIKAEEKLKPVNLFAKEDIIIKDEYISSFEVNLKENSSEKEIVKTEDVKLTQTELSKDIKVIEEIHETQKCEEININDINEFDSNITSDIIEVNITDQIIKMHKEGLKSNEIAKKLQKGVREIDIILRVNNIS